MLVASPGDGGQLSTAANSEGLAAIEQQGPHSTDVQAHRIGYLAVVVAGRQVVHGHPHGGRKTGEFAIRHLPNIDRTVLCPKGPAGRGERTQLGMVRSA